MLSLPRKGCRLYPPHVLEYLALSVQQVPTLKIDVMFPDSSDMVGSFPSRFCGHIFYINNWEGFVCLSSRDEYTV